jgi:uridine phosphorylase
LVGDPGRALLLAQELHEQPKMSNHARGLWGYYGSTPAGLALTIQATGMGGPSAALVLDDLVELGVERAVRVGTCVGFGDAHPPGSLLVVGAAIAAEGSAVALGAAPEAAVAPAAGLSGELAKALGPDAGEVTIVSVDNHPSEASARAGAAAADMQTAALLARAATRRIEMAAVLIVSESQGSTAPLSREKLENLEKRAGRSAVRALSQAKVEG